jgi:hypothetical protein
MIGDDRSDGAAFALRRNALSAYHRPIVNYGFWLLVGQSTQTSLMAAQMRQLGGIQSQLAQQQFIQQQQAALGQLLFDVEQFARGIDRWASQDPFAAGFLAMMRLRSVGEIRPEFFHAVEHKRSWLAVCEHLAARRAVIDQNPQWRDLAGHLARASDDVTRLQGFLGQDPQGRIAIMRSVAEKADSARKVRLWVGVVAAVLAVPSVVTYVGPIILITLTIFMFGGMIAQRKKRDELLANAAQLEQTLAQWHAFQADIYGGRLLERMTAEHPMLMSA